MTFLPVLPLAVLAVLGALIVIARIVTLYRLLARTADGQYRRVVLRWSRVTFAALLLLLAAFRPGLPTEGDDRAAADGSAIPDLNVFFVVDRSVTSRVPDFGDAQARMVGIRNDVTALIDEYRNARFDLIGFATKASVEWPLSEDAFGLKSLVKNLSAYSLTPYDSFQYVYPAAAKEVLPAQLQRAQELYPGSKNVVFYFGDGTTGSKVQPSSFAIAPDLVAGGAVLGYGTTAGGPIPYSFSDGRTTYLADPATLAITYTALDEQRLRQLADNLGVPYFHREAGQAITPVLPAVASGFMMPENAATDADPLIGRTEIYWVFALLSSVLLLVELVLLVREYRRNRLSRFDFPAGQVPR